MRVGVGLTVSAVLAHDKIFAEMRGAGWKALVE